VWLLDCLCSCNRRKAARIVPVLGAFRSAPAAVAPTPQYRAARPILGRTLVAFQLTDSQQVLLSVAFTDKKGNPAPVDGAPTWLVDNPNVLALQPAADGMSCLVLAVGPLGSARVSLTADADMGAGTVDVAGVFDVDVIAGAASVAVISAGAPSEQP
jgi:hypothetical protein